MDILKEIYRLRSLIYFQSVKIIIKQIERTHSILEEFSGRFKIKCSNSNGYQLVVLASLHNISFSHHK